MDEEQQRPEPRLHAPIIILGFVTFIICDLLSLIPFVADFLDAGFAIVTVILAITGIGGTLVIAINFLALIAKAIPVVQALPFYTIAWGIAIAADRNQKVKEVVAVAGVVGGVAEGLGETGAAASVAAGAEEAGSVAAETEAAAETAQTAASAGADEAAALETETAAGNRRPSETSTEREPQEKRPSESGAAAKIAVSEEALGAEAGEFEKMQRMLEETPMDEPQPEAMEDTEKSRSPQSRVEKVNKKVQDISGRFGIQEKRATIDKDDADENSDLPKAA